MCSSFARIMKKEKAEGKVEGKIEGKAEGVIEFLEDIGNPSEELRKMIMEQTDLEVLRKWLKAAARAESIEDFERTAGLARI